MCFYYSSGTSTDRCAIQGANNHAVPSSWQVNPQSQASDKITASADVCDTMKGVGGHPERTLYEALSQSKR